MRPSISVSLEPGLERGVPWGRDLYTFVTSAAGHMMRTLQKPRKNRPSKRQVNHRRFLHNMIQRKFADIEAANHRLASALYFKEEDKTLSSPSRQKPEPPELGNSDLEGFLSDPGEGKDLEEVPESDPFASSRENGKKLRDSRTLWKRRSQHSTCTSRNQSRGKQEEERGNNKVVDYSPVSSIRGLDGYHGEDFPNRECDYNENLAFNQPQHDLGSTHNAEVSLSFTPELSPLSLNSCDFAVQTFGDNSQRADIRMESQWTDIMDLFGLGECLDVEGYFESIGACQGHEVAADEEEGPAAQVAPFASEAEERGEPEYGYGGGCRGDRGPSQRSTEDAAAEAQFHYCKAFQCGDIPPERPPATLGFLCDAAEPHPQERSPCMLESRGGNQNLTPFEGVAQSFSAPFPVSQQRPIQTPPHEDEWLFTDILKDRRLLEC